MPQEYLSTDPNAGLDEEYLSTDPSAGLTQPAPMAPASSHVPVDAEQAPNDASSLSALRASPGFRRMDAEVKGQADRIKENLPAMMAFGAGLAAPGLIPGAIAAGGASYLGSRLRGDSRGKAATGGILEGLMTGGAGSIVKAPQALYRASRRFVGSALKPDRAYLQKMAAARAGGLVGAEDELIDTAINQKVNPFKRGGLDEIQGRVDTTAAKRTGQIEAAPDVPAEGYGKNVVDTLQGRKRASYDATGHPGVESVDTILERVRDNPYYGAPVTAHEAVGLRPRASTTPRDLTPRELAARLEADNTLLRGSFGAEQNAATEAVKDVRRVTAETLDRVAGTAKTSQELKKLIDLRNVSNIAYSRGQGADPLKITDFVSLTAGRPAVLAASGLMRPGIKMATGLAMSNARHIPLRGTAPERAILHELMRAFSAGDNAR